MPFYHIKRFKGRIDSMNLHEHQAKEILKQYGLPIPAFGVAHNVEEAKEIISQLDLNEAVIKIQVHAGGRGKAGGVKIAKNKNEIIEKAKELIGMHMVNNQTGPQGITAEKVMITKPVNIDKEYYLSVVIDRERARPMIIASREGGMDIEQLAETSPEKILKLPFSINGTLKRFQLLRLCSFMGWQGDLAAKGSRIAKGIARAFIELDASILEINPLVKTDKEELSILDLKLSIDDNAIFRHKELALFYDPRQISKAEATAKEFDLSYISMEGNIGCMVNGAGLAMATMDIIKLYGGAPANFLDVGGGASREKVAAGFRIILSDPDVKAVLVNIFGGIMNCETLAEGIIHAAKELDIQVPIVIRMEGTNVEKGRKLLQESKLTLSTTKDLQEAAKTAVEKVK